MERIDDLQINGLTLVQDDETYCFTGDAVLLADFAVLRKGDTVCDFGTGCGIVAILLAGKRPDLGLVTGVEIQGELFRLAQKNVVRNRLSGRVETVLGDLKEFAKSGRVFDAVICNPPYFKRNCCLTGENRSRARGRHELDVTLRELCMSAARSVRSGGKFFLVYPSDRLAELLFELKRNRLEPKRLRAVAVRADAPPHLFLVEAQKDGGEGVKFLPQLALFEGSEESDEVRRIYSRPIRRPGE